MDKPNIKRCYKWITATDLAGFSISIGGSEPDLGCLHLLCVLEGTYDWKTRTGTQTSR